MKKIIFGFIGFIACALAVTAYTAEAAPQLEIPLSGDNMNFAIFIGWGATTSDMFVLPSLSGNDGAVYVIKQRGTNPYGVYVQPAAGDLLDFVPDNSWQLAGAGGYATFVADEANDTWWIIGHGASGFDGY